MNHEPAGAATGPRMAGKTVLITGATGGIGKATAIGLAVLGAHLASPAATATAPRTSPARSAQPVAAGSTCSSPICPPSRKYGDWPTKFSRASPGSMLW